MPATIQAPKPAAPAAPSAPAPAAPKTESPPDIYAAAAEIDELAEQEKPAPVKPEAAKPTKRPPPEPEAEEQEEEPAAEDGDPTSQANKEIDEMFEGEEGEETAKEEAEEKPQAEDKEPEEKFGRMKDLKVVYEKTKAEKKELEAKYAEATKTIENLKRSNPDEVKALAERLQKAESRRDELEQEIKHINYQASDEFKTKYQRPWQEAWARAAKDLSELDVELADGTTRKAEPEDLANLANLPLGEARKKAIEMFGDAANDVMLHRRKILDLSEAQEAALAESRKASKERDQARIVEERAKGEKLRAMYGETVQQIAEKYPRVFKPVPGDDEGNALFEKGLAEVDRFFNDTQMPIEERVKMHAMLRFKAGAFERAQLRLVRMAAKLKQAKAELAAYEKSAPPGGGRMGGRKSAPENEDVFAKAEREIDELVEG